MVITTRCAAETERLGECLGAILDQGDVVTLSGDLGAGKTCFAQGIAVGLGVDSAHPVTSPTFTLLNEYQGRHPLYHFDFYRLGRGEDLRDLGFEEYFSGSGICLVEWPERLPGQLSAERLAVTIAVEENDIRSVTFTPCGEKYEQKVTNLLETAEKCFDRNRNLCY